MQTGTKLFSFQREFVGFKYPSNIAIVFDLGKYFLNSKPSSNFATKKKLHPDLDSIGQTSFTPQPYASAFTTAAVKPGLLNLDKKR